MNTQLDVIQKIAVRKPKLYKIMLINDDHTPDGFVHEVLKEVFQKNDSEAEHLIMQAQHYGEAMIGVYLKDIAEAKKFRVDTISRSHNHPLTVEIKPD